MNHFNALKKALLVSFLGLAGTMNGQTVHPIADNMVGGNTVKNMYKDYVGTRLEVTYPAAIAGDKNYTVANDGSGATGMWGGVITTPIVNDTVVMAPAGYDSSGCSAFPPGSMTGKIALIWRGPIGSPCEFDCKALYAQNAGAIAVVLINEYPGEGPVGMGTGTVCSAASISIPVFMVGNLDGIAMVNQYRSGVPVTMTITPWGLGYQHDLGFVPGGISTWHDYAIPANQLTGSNPRPYKMLDGAFIANYGTSNATNVKLKATTRFTPNGGSPTTINVDSQTLASFPAVDSIWALYADSLFNLPELPGLGRYDVTYNITSDSVDQYMGDNTTSYSFYTTDSLYSKGRYDFANHRPFVSLYESAGAPAGGSAPPYIWGPMYYVAKGGTAADSVQYSLSVSTGAGPIPTGTSVNVYIFKWVDGSNGQPLDSFVENGELNLMGTAIKNFSATDSSDGYFTVGVTDSNGHAKVVTLDSNSWYYIGAEMPTAGTTIFYLGVDGVMDAFPRMFGLNHFHGILEYNGPVWAGDRGTSTNNQYAFPGAALEPAPFGGSFNTDSVVYNTQKGLVPSIPLIALNHIPAVDTTTDTTHHGGGAGVHNVSSVYSKFSVYPNPASDYVNVAIELYATAKVVTYTILDAGGKVVSKESHNNVLNDTYTYATSKLAAGNYFMVVNVDDKAVFKKFTVIK